MPNILINNAAPVLGHPYKFSSSGDTQVFIFPVGSSTFTADIRMLSNPVDGFDAVVADYSDMLEDGDMNLTELYTQQKNMGLGEYAIVFTAFTGTVRAGFYKNEL